MNIEAAARGLFQLAGHFAIIAWAAQAFFAIQRGKHALEASQRVRKQADEALLPALRILMVAGTASPERPATLIAFGTTALTLQNVVNEIVEEMRHRTQRGTVASYIPELARADANAFGMAIADASDVVISGGDADQTFSIQSISKVFTLTMALGRIGDRLWQRVGREPSGSPFNSIVQLEAEHGIPRNPFINAGALVVTDAILSGHEPRVALGEIVRFLQFLSDDPSISIDKAIARSEQGVPYRNAALANYMKAFGNLENPVEFTLGVYFHHCAIAMSCRQLARAGRFLAFGGRNPATDHIVVKPVRARRINAIMLTCGHYDGSGEFAFRVGLPGKSGVGGGILAIVPGRASIAVWSPGLDEVGNSLLGRLALERLTQRMGWSVFGT